MLANEAVCVLRRAGLELIVASCPRTIFATVATRSASPFHIFENKNRPPGTRWHLRGNQIRRYPGASTPSIDATPVNGVAMSVPHRSASQRGHVIAGNREQFLVPPT